MFVKICGMTSVAAIEAAAAAGADAVGFVFAASPREVSPDRARVLCAAVPPGLLRVAVMRHPAAEHFERVIEIFEPDWVQTDAEDLASLVLPTGCRALPVYRNGRVPDADAPPPRILFEGVESGTGTTADWDEAGQLARVTELVLAGGLNPENVAAAIARVRPWGVDVSSGVESSPGRKDPARIIEFVARARAMEKAS